MAKFDIYAALLVEWQARMNLVGPSTLADVWVRHFADSAQLAALVETNDESTWLDIGSGAGFPGLVTALLCRGRFNLIEATTKKCRFLEAAAAAVGLADRVTVYNVRVEALAPIRADVITARACAPLDRLFAWGLVHGRRARWLLLKGRSAEVELAAARATFDFTADLIPSRTDPQARIVRARDIVCRSAR